MAVGHEKQHKLEYGGSDVTTEFPGQLQFRLVDRIPVLVLSHQFDEEAARAVRYSLVATVGPERPYYHRYRYVVLDVRMVSEWLPGSGKFVKALADRIKSLGGDLYVISTVPLPDEAVGVQRFETAEDAVAAAKKLRAENRLKAITV
jgi:hypothetical protein